MSTTITVSKKPSRQEIEKIAQTIVIKVHEDEEACPYDMIRSTGMQPNLMETLLKKFNIFNLLHDMENSGDAHNKDVGTPPLSLDKLFPCGSDMPDGTTVKKIEGPGVRGVAIKKKVTLPLDQSMDMHAISKEDLGKEEPKAEPKEEVEEKQASFQDHVAQFDDIPTSRLRSARNVMRDEIVLLGHTYKGQIEKIASVMQAHPDVELELARCHHKSKVAHHIFAAAGTEIPEVERPKWTVQTNTKLAALVDALEDDLKHIGEQQDSLDFIDSVIAGRNGE